MKYILLEPKFLLQEKYLLDEKYKLQEASTLIEGQKISAADYPNIIKFYPEAATRADFWQSERIHLPDVSAFDKYMKRRLNSYFGVNWITRGHCDALIIEASKQKAGRNFSGVSKLYTQFEEKAKKIAQLFHQTSENLTTTKDTIVEYYEKLKTELLDNREKSKTDTDEFIKILSNFIPSIEHVADLTTAQTSIKEFIERVENTRFFKTFNDETFTAVFTALKEKSTLDVNDDRIKKTLKSTLPKDIKVLKQLVDEIQKKTLDTFMDAETLETLKPVTENVIKLLPRCEATIQQKEKQVTTLEPLEAFKPVEDFIELLNNLNTFIAADITPAAIEQRVTDTITKFKNFLAEVPSKLQEIVSIKTVENAGKIMDPASSPENSATTEEDSESPLSDTDWDREFRNAVNKNVFWSSYLRRAWSGQETKLNPILKAIQIECTTYGFKAELNPFLSYIKNYYLNPAYDMTQSAYFAIHDAVVKNYIKADDLVAKKNDLGSQDIIFCKHLARKSGKDILDYLSLQKDLLKAISKLKPDSEELATLKQSLGNETISKKDIKRIHFAIMYDVGDLTKPETKITNFTTDTADLRLRSHQDIQLLITKLGGKVNKAATDPQIATYVEDLKDRNTAIETFVIVATQYVDQPNRFLKHYIETKNKDALAVDVLLKVKATLEKLGRIDETTAKKILNLIAEKYNFTKVTTSDNAGD